MEDSYSLEQKERVVRQGLIRMDAASQFLSADIIRSLDERKIDSRYEVGGGVYASERLITAVLVKHPELSRDQIAVSNLLETAREAGLEVGYYAGGIGHGIEGNPSEEYQKTGVAGMRPARPETGVSAAMLHERIFAASGKQEPLAEAADFLADQFDLVLTSEPPRGRRGLLSSPVADAVARKTIWAEIKNHKVNFEVFLWSDSAFKFSQESWAAFLAIDQDISQAIDMGLLSENDLGRDKDKIKRALLAVKIENRRRRENENWERYGFDEREQIHLSGYDGAEYCELQEGADMVLGGAPHTREALTWPGVPGEPGIKAKVKNTAKITGARIFSRILGKLEKGRLLEGVLTDRPAPVWLTEKLWQVLPEKLKQNPKAVEIHEKLVSGKLLPGNFGLLLSRLGEIGRSYAPETEIVKKNRTSLRLAREFMAEMRGQGVTTILYGPGVGDVVDDTRSRVGEIMEAMMPGKVLCVSGKPEVPYAGESGLEYRHTPHSLIKERGVVEQIRAIESAWHLGLIGPAERKKAWYHDAEFTEKTASRIVPVEIKPAGKHISGSVVRREMAYMTDKVEEMKKAAESHSLSDEQSKQFSRFYKLWREKRQAIYIEVPTLPEKLRQLGLALWFVVGDEEGGRPAKLWGEWEIKATEQMQLPKDLRLDS